MTATRILFMACALAVVSRMQASEITGNAQGCFPDPNYPVPRPPQCVGGTGSAVYTETGGPNRDLQYYGSTFETGSSSFTVDLGTLTLVGAGIGSTINDDLHLSINLANQRGEPDTADYVVSARGFAFYDTMRNQSAGQVQLDFGDPEPRSFDTVLGLYSLTLDVPTSPFSLTIPPAASSISYQISGSLTPLGRQTDEAVSLVPTPEPGTLLLLGVAGCLLAVPLKRHHHEQKRK